MADQDNPNKTEQGVNKVVIVDRFGRVTDAAGAGTAGNVGVSSLPADPLGLIADALVAAGATGSISAKLRRATQGLEDLKTLLVLAAGENVVGRVGFNTARVRATLNAVSPGVIAAAGDYAALDVLNQSTSAGVHWVLPSIARVSGYGGVITKVFATVSVAGLTARLRLHLFTSVPTILQNDNAALLIDADDRAAYLGYIDLPAFSTSGSSEIAWAQAELSHSFKCTATANLFFVVQTLDAITNESASMTLDFHVTASQD